MSRPAVFSNKMNLAAGLAVLQRRSSKLLNACQAKDNRPDGVYFIVLSLPKDHLFSMDAINRANQQL
jgi:hypothetical protein